MTDGDDLAGLLSARICHDLVGPVGAIFNGLELIEPGAPLPREEHALMEDSARAARAALGFLRLAFGAAEDGASPMPLAELRKLAEAHLGSDRCAFAWPEAGSELPRPIARITALALLSAARALPRGGVVRLSDVTAAPLSVAVEAEGRHAAFEPASRSAIEGRADGETPRQAHLLLLRTLARARGARLVAEEEAERATLRIEPEA